jgi:DNA-binding MarR family transcriptional regulator
MEQLNETQREILSALDERGGRGNTSNIKRSIGEMTTSNLGKQARSLAEMGLIEKVGEEGRRRSDSCERVCADRRRR